jgi:hypothetical protein
VRTSSISMASYRLSMTALSRMLVKCRDEYEHI